MVNLAAMQWDPFTTLSRTLWITGGQWAGKSTVAGILAEDYGLTHYHYDYHAARGHEDRRIAAQIRRGESPTELDPQIHFVETSPRVAAAEVIRSFPERFEWVLDDLRALVSGRPIIADGWGLRPELVLPVAGSPGQVVVMVPTVVFREHQSRTLDRATALSHRVDDPALGQRNRIERDRLIAADAVAAARVLGIRVIQVDGTRDARAVADEVADHFSTFLPQAARR
jgi:hypothetical protein